MVVLTVLFGLYIILHWLLFLTVLLGLKNAILPFILTISWYCWGFTACYCWYVIILCFIWMVFLTVLFRLYVILHWSLFLTVLLGLKNANLPFILKISWYCWGFTACYGGMLLFCVSFDGFSHSIVGSERYFALIIFSLYCWGWRMLICLSFWKSHDSWGFTAYYCWYVIILCFIWWFFSLYIV